VRITGITFVGTRTGVRPAMTEFLRDVLRLSPSEPTVGMDADVFDLPDGSSFAVAAAMAPDEQERTVGFSVADVHEARRALETAGVWVDEEVTENDRYLYLHFRAPDGRLYELVEERVKGT
jgi:catechol 2,3-dioxygenase-like lactoylglutathione lyase family enzyme